MKYFTFWLVCFGITMGLIDDEERDVAYEGIVFVAALAPAFAASEVFELISRDCK